MPSFVTVMLFAESTNILSIPFGPSVVFTISAISLAARMLLRCAFWPSVLETFSEIIVFSDIFDLYDWNFLKIYVISHISLFPCRI